MQALVISRSAVPGPVPPVAKGRTGVKERWVDHPPVPSTVPLTASTGPSLPSRPGKHQAPCRRCQLSGQPCIFEKPEKKNGQLLSTASVECDLIHPLVVFPFSQFFSLPFHRRLSRLEGQYVVSLSFDPFLLPLVMSPTRLCKVK